MAGGRVKRSLNGIKTALLLRLLSGCLLVGGGALGGERGLFYGLLLAIGMNFFSYFFSDKMALMSARAQSVSETQHPEIYRRLAPLVRSLAERMGIPMPKPWVTPDLSPNAFATGRNPAHASVAVTSGILEIMPDRELSAVVAHELGHVKNRDILISSIAADAGLRHHPPGANGDVVRRRKRRPGPPRRQPVCPSPDGHPRATGRD
jgi:heat shock protein HtpX